MEKGPARVGRGELILMVENHPDSREMYREWLQFVGFRVVCCAAADEGLRSARELHPAAITTEFELHGKDGTEFCAALKSDDRTAGIPLIVVTSWATEARIGRARHLGCAAILVKPVLPSAMADEIRRVLPLPPSPD